MSPSFDWDGLSRADGTRLERLSSGRFVIVPRRRLPFILYCPTCCSELNAVSQAKYVADYIYPLPLILEDDGG